MQKQTGVKTLIVMNAAIWTVCDAQSETSGHVNHCNYVDFSSGDLHRIYIIATFVTQQAKE